MNFKQLVFGKRLNPFQPGIFRHIGLVAFFAWVGLGSDGLSSACYGPAESFYSLGNNTPLALFIALATIVTVFIIALGYNQVVELFPSGGGGYKTATELLGRHAGLLSGCALLIDFVLTIAISAASGTDAFFSFLPVKWMAYRLWVEVIIIGVLVLINLRGAKESIKFL